MTIKKENTDKSSESITLRELIEQRFGFVDKALEIQAREYERRLEILNHAHEQAVEVQRTYLQKESFEVFTVEQRKEIKEIKNNLVEFLKKDEYNLLVNEYHTQYQILKDLVISNSEKFLNLLNEKTISIEKWQYQQDAIIKEREKTTNWKLTIISLILLGLDLILRFFKI